MAQPYYTEIPMSINDIPIADADLGNSSELLIWHNILSIFLFFAIISLDVELPCTYINV